MARKPSKPVKDTKDKNKKTVGLGKIDRIKPTAKNKPKKKGKT